MNKVVFFRVAQPDGATVLLGAAQTKYPSLKEEGLMISDEIREVMRFALTIKVGEDGKKEVRGEDVLVVFDRDACTGKEVEVIERFAELGATLVEVQEPFDSAGPHDRAAVAQWVSTGVMGAAPDPVADTSDDELFDMLLSGGSDDRPASVAAADVSVPTEEAAPERPVAATPQAPPIPGDDDDFALPGLEPAAEPATPEPVTPEPVTPEPVAKTAAPEPATPETVVPASTPDPAAPSVPAADDPLAPVAPVDAMPEPVAEPAAPDRDEGDQWGDATAATQMSTPDVSAPSVPSVDLWDDDVTAEEDDELFDPISAASPPAIAAPAAPVAPSAPAASAPAPASAPVPEPVTPVTPIDAAPLQVPTPDVPETLTPLAPAVEPAPVPGPEPEIPLPSVPDAVSAPTPEPDTAAPQAPAMGAAPQQRPARVLRSISDDAASFESFAAAGAQARAAALEDPPPPAPASPAAPAPAPEPVAASTVEEPPLPPAEDDMFSAREDVDLRTVQAVDLAGPPPEVERPRGDFAESAPEVVAAVEDPLAAAPVPAAVGDTPPTVQSRPDMSRMALPGMRKGTSILITGSHGGCGKTTIAYLMPYVMAYLAKQQATPKPVYLIEADYSNPKLAQRFSLRPEQNSWEFAKFVQALSSGEISNLTPEAVQQRTREIIDKISHVEKSTGLRVIACPYDTTSRDTDALRDAIQKLINGLVAREDCLVFIDGQTFAKDDVLDSTLAATADGVVLVGNARHVEDAQSFRHMLTTPVEANGAGVATDRISVFLNQTSKTRALELAHEFRPVPVVGFLPQMEDIDDSTDERTVAWVGESLRGEALSDTVTFVAQSLRNFLPDDPALDPLLAALADRPIKGNYGLGAARQGKRKRRKFSIRR